MSLGSCWTGLVSLDEERSVTDVLVLVTGDESSVPAAVVRVVTVVPDEEDVDRMDAFPLSPLLLGSFSLSRASLSLASRSAFSRASRSLASLRLLTQASPLPSSSSPPPTRTWPIPHSGAAWVMRLRPAASLGTAVAAVFAGERGGPMT